MDDRELRALLNEVMEELDQARPPGPPGPMLRPGRGIRAAALVAGLGAMGLGAAGLLAQGSCSGPQGGQVAPTPVTRQAGPDKGTPGPDAGPAKRPVGQDAGQAKRPEGQDAGQARRPVGQDAGQARRPAPDPRPVDPGSVAEYGVPFTSRNPVPSRSPPAPMPPRRPDPGDQPLYGVPEPD